MALPAAAMVGLKNAIAIIKVAKQSEGFSSLQTYLIEEQAVAGRNNDHRSKLN
jgi:hypothetical protein